MCFNKCLCFILSFDKNKNGRDEVKKNKIIYKVSKEY